MTTNTPDNKNHCRPPIHDDVNTSVNAPQDSSVDPMVGPMVDDWDFKLATLFSIFESTPEDVLHNALISAKGDLEQAIPLILSSSSNDSNHDRRSTDDYPRKKQKLIQPRLSAFLPTPASSSSSSLPSTSFSLQKSSSSSISSTSTSSHSKESTAHLPSLNDRLRWKDSINDTSAVTLTSSSNRPKPLVIYSPEDVAKRCPCTLIFNVLDKDLATRLLKVMLEDSETWNRNRWWLFERMVESPHKTSYFAERDDDMEEVAGWTYNGMKQDPPRRFLPEMNEAKLVVRRIVNDLRKTRTLHPFEAQGDWNCNVAAVNHYAHSKESVGWHADKLTYLGPRPTIGSLTLGATRFFRIRKVVPDAKNPDTAGQLISIALPHNSLCIMWPPMQEEWKHEVPPQATVTPHPISGTARINITYRFRREGFSPEDTPVCKCGVAMVLRCVFKNKANYGKYFYMCYGAGSQEGRTCGEFHWVDMEEKLRLISNRGKEQSINTTSEEDRVQESMSSVQNSNDDDDELDLAKELEEDVELLDLPLDTIAEDDLIE